MKKSANSEIETLASFLQGMPRSKLQTHGLNESDCEVLKLSSKLYLATSVDSVSEEWLYRLYRNLDTLANLCVQGTLSDLLACGIQPQGFLFSPLWPKIESNQELNQMKKEIFKSIKASLQKSKVALLGGDQGEAASLSLTGIALGTSQKKPLSRLGIKPGDHLCLLGELGMGPALGFSYLLESPEREELEKQYRPVAELSAAPALLKFARAAIDTSDGLCSSIHQLSVLNQIHFEIAPDQVSVSKRAAEFCRNHDLPKLSLWYGEHGDYQLLFAVSPQNLKAIQKALPKMKVIGRALPAREKEHRLRIDGKNFLFQPGLLAHEPKNDLKSLKRAFELALAAVKKIGTPDVVKGQ